MKFTRESPTASTEYYIPDSAVEGHPLIDARSFKEISVQVDADQPVDVYIQNAPDGDVSNARDLAGYSIAAADFSTGSRNMINMDGGNSLLGWMRVRIVTGTTAPSSITVWVVAR